MLDYQAIAVDRLTGQFAESPKLRALTAAIVSMLADLEIAADDLREKRLIDTAEGVQLDGCGAIVGEPRNGLSDEDYRARLKFRIFANTSRATPADMIKALKFLTSPGDCQYLEAYPATALLFTDGPIVPRSIQAEIQTFAPAGISDVPVAVSFGAKPMRFGRESTVGELFVNDEYLEVDGSDLQVTLSGVAISSAALGGCVPAELDVGIGYLDIGGPTLAVYNPNQVTPMGEFELTGVYQ